MTGDTEGVIKYRLNHRTAALPDSPELDALQACRQVLYQQGLIGQDPTRYGGLGYGNVSCRIGRCGDFLITGSQTGHLAEVRKQHFVMVTDYLRGSNTLTSQGLLKPSSESSTHAFLYTLSRRINAVIHVHSPALWHYAVDAGLPATAATAPFGSPELLTEIESLWQQQSFDNGPLLVMLGHKDGIISFAESLANAWTALQQHGLKLI